MSDQRGEISLIGLIVSMTIFLIVLGATLQMFSTSERVNHDARERNDVQDSARMTLDKLSRQLRNLASPTPEKPEADGRVDGSQHRLERGERQARPLLPRRIVPPASPGADSLDLGDGAGSPQRCRVSGRRVERGLRGG
jgi:hypothetical protein